MRKGLGKGLSALISGSEEEYANATRRTESFSEPLETEVKNEVDIDMIVVNDKQPRKVFDEVALTELSNSIQVYGIITPLIVVEKGSQYMIIAGERRYRAAKRAGLRKVPVIIRDYTQQEISEISLIDNLQREDLNAIEKALAIKGLIDEFNYTQEEVAGKLSKSRSAVTNTLRLLLLAPDVIQLVYKGRLSEGHARCLIGIDNRETQLKLALEASDGKLSVREFENRIKAYKKPGSFSKIKSGKKNQFMPIELADLVQKMQNFFGTKVTALGTDRKGRLIIEYYTRDDLDRIFELMNS